jgi:hypothetical protein
MNPDTPDVTYCIDARGAGIAKLIVNRSERQRR